MAPKKTALANQLKRYSPEDDRKIREMWNAYEPIEQIAAAVKRTPGTVRQRVHQLGLKRLNSVARALTWAPKHLAAKRKELGNTRFLERAYKWREEQRRGQAAA